MEKLILKYLNKNFMFTLSTMSSYMVKSKSNEENVSVQSLTKEVMEVFQISEEKLTPILNKWYDNELIKINNIIADAQYLMYEKKIKNLDSYKGYISDINKLINKS